MRPLKTYQTLMKECDRFFNRVQQKYPQAVTCHNGCSDCCICGSVFAIEAYFIALFWAKNRSDEHVLLNDRVRSAQSDFCLFLKHGKCRIYQVRPLVCRTHGLALATFKEDYLDWNSCPLNFKKGLPSDFNRADFFAIDQVNDDLALLNIHFCRQLGLDRDRNRISLEELYNAPEDFLRFTELL